ncbi:Uncharacterised protein [Pantoea agglomerans]|uniref:Uncharacterized protein n=1 Tax=Enterobacter agglomerans TaxID=549 RepID=A0A379AC13_ENTAG|nr:Uncharacterised protein [Pantoea agglomerans]
MVLWRSCLTIACGLPLLTGSISAWSLPTSTFQVTASIVAGCVISGTNTGVFGTLNFGTPVWRGGEYRQRQLSAEHLD